MIQHRREGTAHLSPYKEVFITIKSSAPLWPEIPYLRGRGHTELLTGAIHIAKPSGSPSKVRRAKLGLRVPFGNMCRQHQRVPVPPEPVISRID